MRKIFLDFDETIIKANSFPLWIKFLIKKSFFKLDFSIFFNLIYLSFCRKVFKKISHKQYKSNVFKLNIKKSWCEEFSCILMAHLNVNVINVLLKELEKTDVLVITSAAPENYLHYFANTLSKKIEFPIEVIGSHFTKDGCFFDNFQENKLISFNDFCDKNIYNNELYMFFTDSIDDVSLADICTKLFVIKSDLPAYEFYKNRYTEFSTSKFVFELPS